MLETLSKFCPMHNRLHHPNDFHLQGCLSLAFNYSTSQQRQEARGEIGLRIRRREGALGNLWKEFLL